MGLGTLPESPASEGDDGGDAAIFAEINITPLTDIFLVMLIIFMVAAAAVLDKVVDEHDRVKEQVKAEKQSGMQVDMPSGEAQEIDPSAASIIVAIAVSGELAVNGEPILDRDLDDVFRAAFIRNKLTQVVLKVDTNVPHGRVVNVMERAKRIGLRKLAIGTRRGE